MKESQKNEQKKQEPTNHVHLYGDITKVTPANNEGPKAAYFLDVRTTESYVRKNEKGEDVREYKDTYHNVSLATDDKNLIGQLNAIGADCEANRNKEAENFQYKKHTVSLDGVFITRKKEAENGVTYYNNLIITKPENMRLEAKKEENEVRNAAEFKGNIASIDMKDGFAIISIATHHFVPGEGTNYKGKTKDYHEVTTFIETRISENSRKDTFAKLTSGEIAVGDLVKVRGQIHGNDFTDGNGVKRHKMTTDLNTIEVVAKKKAKTEKETANENVNEETKAEEKNETKKAKPRKSTVKIG